MPSRKQPATPSYRLHKARNAAVVTLCGQNHYLGKYGSPESRAEYDRLISTWLANGRRLPDAQPEPEISVNEVALAYFKFAKDHYANRRQAGKAISRIKCALRPVKKLFGLAPASSFGPKALVALRERYIADGLARKTVNDNVKVVVRMFKWAVREEMVPAIV